MQGVPRRGCYFNYYARHVKHSTNCYFTWIIICTKIPSSFTCLWLMTSKCKKKQNKGTNFFKSNSPRTTLHFFSQNYKQQFIMFIVLCFCSIKIHCYLLKPSLHYTTCFINVCLSNIFNINLFYKHVKQISCITKVYKTPISFGLSDSVRES